MNRKCLTTSLIIVFLITLSAITENVVEVQAETPVRKVGVVADDWALYDDFEVTWNPSDPDAKPSQELIDANMTEWMEISVRFANQTGDPMGITFEKISHFTNEPEKKTTHYVDVEDGSGDGTLSFISAGLEEGDLLYNFTMPWEHQLRINDTISRIYAGEVRETNILNLTLKEDVDGDQVIETTAHFYWDKATGIQTEFWSKVVNKTGSYTNTWTRSYRLVETNLWGTPDTHPPVADAGLNQTVYTNIETTLDASRSTDNVGITSYTWTFMDENPKILNGVNPTYTFTSVGVYEITLNVTDAAQLWDIDIVTITVLEDTIPPVAEAGPNQTAPENTPVIFDASGSSDNAGIISYHWDFGDGLEESGSIVIHTYTQAGTYTVTLTVQDAADNTDLDTTIVAIEAAGEPPYLLIGGLVIFFAVIVAVALWRRRK